MLMCNGGPCIRKDLEVPDICCKECLFVKECSDPCTACADIACNYRVEVKDETDIH